MSVEEGCQVAGVTDGVTGMLVSKALGHEPLEKGSFVVAVDAQDLFFGLGGVVLRRNGKRESTVCSIRK